MANRISSATVAAIEDMVAAAYDELADGPQDWVRLADLRPYLADYDRADVDAVLVAMTGTGLVHLAPISGRTRNHPENVDAAVGVGGELKQLIAIDGEYFDTED